MSGSLALVTFHEGTVTVSPDHGSTAEVQRDATGSKLCIRRKHLDLRRQHLHAPAPQDVEDVSEDNDEEN